MQKRCPWCLNDPLYIQYHDQEWGVPLYDDQQLFEMLFLETMQAGLSWLTILKKRENFRDSFEQFDAEKMAYYDEKKVKQLLLNPNIIRNRLKIEAAITNAQAYLNIVEKYDSFSDFIWQFTDGKPLQPVERPLYRMPTSSLESDRMSLALKHQGFKFVGTTTCYAFMQAVGMINDHMADCFRYRAIKDMTSEMVLMSNAF